MVQRAMLDVKDTIGTRTRVAPGLRHIRRFPEVYQKNRDGSVVHWVLVLTLVFVEAIILNTAVERGCRVPR